MKIDALVAVLVLIFALRMFSGTPRKGRLRLSTTRTSAGIAIHVYWNVKKKQLSCAFHYRYQLCTNRMEGDS